MKINEIIAEQQKYFSSNATKDVSFRIKQLKKLKQLLKENEGLLYKAIYQDFAKSEFETYVSELSLLYGEINTFLKHIKKWSKRKRVPTGLVNFPAKSYIIPEPLGMTLIIGAWNYPYQLSLLPAVTSLAAGNTVILKPSELSAETSRVMAEIINNNFPAGYFHVVEGDAAVTTELLGYRFDKIFFTGSIPTGKIIYSAAAKHLTPVTLELGGKSPAFVLPGCDMKTTAKRIVWAKFLNAGQTCIAPDYILVERSLEPSLLEALAGETEKHYNFENGLPDNYTKIINAKRFDRLMELIDKEKIYYGGQTGKADRFIGPTILKDVSFDDEVMKEEIFGPILPVLAFDDLDMAVRQVKSMPKPLACYVYSGNRKTIGKILQALSFGGGAVNDSVMHFSNPRLPFGGVGHSGIGAYHGKTGFDTFSHYKSILDKPFWFEPNLKYAPYTPQKLRLIKWLME